MHSGRCPVKEMTSSNMAASMQEDIVFRFFCCTTILFCFYTTLHAQNEEFEEVLLCRQCGHEITSASHIVQKPSKLAHRQRNDTILGEDGVLIQLFINPAGRRFELITATQADVYKGDKAFSEHSWYPGFLWRMSLCPRCGFHLGWSFEPTYHTEGKKDTEHTFTGLILENLLHEDYADNLLITPKSYYS